MHIYWRCFLIISIFFCFQIKAMEDREALRNPTPQISNEDLGKILSSLRLGLENNALFSQDLEEINGLEAKIATSVQTNASEEDMLLFIGIIDKLAKSPDQNIQELIVSLQINSHSNRFSLSKYGKIFIEKFISTYETITRAHIIFVLFEAYLFARLNNEYSNKTVADIIALFAYFIKYQYPENFFDKNVGKFGIIWLWYNEFIMGRQI